MKIIHKLSEHVKGLFSKKPKIEINVHKLLNILNSPSRTEEINGKSEIELIKPFEDISEKKFNSTFITQDLAKILNVNNYSINVEELINLLKREDNRKAIFNLLRINNEYITTEEGFKRLTLKNIKQSPKVIEDLLSNTKTNKLPFNNIDNGCLLNHAIKCNEDKIVKLLIEKGAPVDMSTIYYCIEHGKFEIFDFLIQIMKNELLIGRKYHELFDYAVKQEKYSFIDIILGNVNVNSVDSKGKTFLHHAVELKDLEMVKKLINKGAKLNCIDQNGCTPLNLAIKSRNVEITNLLLDKKAKYNCIHIDNRVLTEEDFEFLWPLAENKGLVLKSEQNSGPSVNQLNTSLANGPWVMQKDPGTTLQQVRNANLIQMISSV